LQVPVKPIAPVTTSWHEDWFKLTTFSLRLRLLVAVSDPLQLKMELKVPY
jgi:hypothetical protein